jgi:hypothetical protein
MMRHWIKALLFTTAVGTLLGLGLHWGWSADRWPAVEMPPKQGESVSTSDVVRGILRHDPVALARVIREPQNTWSNLAFVLAGAVVWTHTSRRIVRAAAGGLMLTGLGSFLYHASASLAVRAVDVGAMKVYFGLSAIVALVVLRPTWQQAAERYAALGAVIVIALAAVITPIRGMKVAGFRPFDIGLLTLASAVIAAVALVKSALAARQRGPWLALSASTVLIAVAVAFQVGDRPGGWCFQPGGMLQGHAVWHVLSAAAAGLSLAQLDHALRRNALSR